MPETRLEKRSIILIDKVRILDTKANTLASMLSSYVMNCYYQGTTIDGNKLIEYATRIQKLTIEKETTLAELNK